MQSNLFHLLSPLNVKVPQRRQNAVKYGFSLKGELNTTENNIRQNLSNLVGGERRVCAAETLGGLQVMRGQHEGP